MRISDWSSDVCSSDLQGTEQLRLKGKRQFRNFVQEQRPTIGRLEQAVGRSRRARKCAFAMAEEHGLHHRFGQSRAVDRNEILVGPVAAHMNEARSEEHTSELQSLMRISYAVFCLKKKNTQKKNR